MHAKAAKLIFKLPKETSDLKSLELVKWMPLKYLYNGRLAVLMHDCFKENTDNRMSVLLFQKSRNNKMQICRMNDEGGRISLRYRGPAIWNCLPKSMRSIDSKEKGPVKLIKRVKIAHSFLLSVSDQFYVIILNLLM